MLVLTGVSGLLLMRYSAVGAESRPAEKFPAFMGYLGLLLLGSGIVTSSVTRFEGTITLTESQELTFADMGYDAGSLYRCRFSMTPTGSIFMRSIASLPSKNDPLYGRYSADALYRKDPSSSPLELRINSMLPSHADGFYYNIEEAGYSPHFTLFDLGGNIIQDVYGAMRLLPAGAEDFFRFDNVIPHTFYLSYYPDVSLVPDKTEGLDIKSGPVYKVRIARNLDLIVDRYAAPEEIIRFDALLLSVGGVKKWVSIHIVRDPGMILMLPGFVLMICSAILVAYRRFARRAGP